MFNLLRDSIFRPKRIIQYRNKPLWFVILFLLILGLINAFSVIAPSFSYKAFTYNQKIEVVNAFKDSDAYIVNGVYHSSTNLTVGFGDYVFGFVKDDGSVDDFVSSTGPDFIVSGNQIYIVAGGLGIYKANKLLKITDLSSDFLNVDLSSLTVDSAFFKGVNDTISTYKPQALGLYFGFYFADGIFNTLFYALFAFLLVILFFQAQKYMKKTQLFKMMIFSSTAITLVQAFINILGINSIFIYLLFIIGFIPLYILEKEIFIRIRMYQITKGLVQEDDFMRRIMGKEKKDDDIDNNDNNENDE